MKRVSLPFSSMLVRWRAPLLVAGACAALSGCVVYPANTYDYSYAGGDVYAPMAPPAIQTEVIPAAPSPGYVWIGGSWGWSSGRYAWSPGRWAMPPRPGYSWYAQPWRQGPRGWHGGGGRWGPRR